MKNYLIEYKKISFEHWHMDGKFGCTEWSWKSIISQQEYDEQLGDWKEHNRGYITEQVMADAITEIKQHAATVCCEMEYNEYANVCNNI